jgi:hypothetical protein
MSGVKAVAARLHADGFAVVAGVVGEGVAGQIREELGAAASEPGAHRRRGSMYAIRDPLNVSRSAMRTATEGALGELARALLGLAARPVKSIYFDKSPGANWKVAWHQDLAIAVRARADVAGYGPWSEREGVLQVRPPRDVLEHIVTLRLHLDPCGEDDGPLLVVPGTHLGGIVPEREIGAMGLDARAVACLAGAGDVVLMKPLTLHASRESRKASHRRVLHVEYAAMGLTGGLEWA